MQALWVALSNSIGLNTVLLNKLQNPSLGLGTGSSEEGSGHRERGRVWAQGARKGLGTGSSEEGSGHRE